MSYVDIRDVDISGFYRIGKAGYGGDSTDVSNLLQNGVVNLYSTVGAFAALKFDGSVVTWGGVEGIVSVNPWFVDLSYNIAYLDGKYVGIGKYDPPVFSANDKRRFDVSANMYVDGILNVADISSSYLESVKSEWERRPASALTYTKGNVGIGKTDPSTTLDISGHVHLTGNFAVNQNLFRADISNQQVSIGHTTTTTVASTFDVSGSLTCNGNTNICDGTLFTDAELKRVGIMDTTPQYTLDVSGSGQFRNANNQMSSQTVFRIRNLTQAMLGNPVHVRLANTNTAILFQPTAIGNFTNTSSPTLLYAFDTHVYMTSVVYTLNVNNAPSGAFTGTITHRIFLVDKNGTLIPNTDYEWNQTANGNLSFSLNAGALASLTSNRFPIRILYTYDATYVDTTSQYIINTMQVAVSYRSNALQVIGNMNVLDGTVSIGKTVSTTGSIPTVDISGTLSTTQDIRVGGNKFILNTTTGNLGIGCEPSSVVAIDVSSVYTGNILRLRNDGMSAGSTLGMSVGQGNTSTNSFQMTYDHTATGSSSNRLIIGTPDVSSIISVEANQNVGIGLLGARPTCRLSLGTHSSTRTLALHENNSGDRFYGFGARYSAMGDVSNTLHLYARSSGASSQQYGQLMLTEQGNVGISTNTRPIDRRLVIGNTGQLSGAFLEFDNRATYDPLISANYKGYAIGSAVNEYGTSNVGMLHFVYTGSPDDGERNDILMSLNSSGNLGIGTPATSNILDISSSAAVRMSVGGVSMIRPGTSTNTMTVDTTNSAVAINKNTASSTLDVNGTMTVSGTTTLQGNLVVDTQTLFVDSVRNRIGISNLNPNHPLDVVGSASIITNASTSVLISDTSSNGMIIRNTNSSGGSVLRLQNNISNEFITLGIGGNANTVPLYTGATYMSNAVLHTKNSWLIGNESNNPVCIYTNMQERMRVDGSGNIGIGTGTDVINRAKVVVEGFQSFPNSVNATSFNYGGSNTSINISTRPISLYCSHNVACNAVIVFSDERIKKDIRPLDNDESLRKINELNPVSFQYIDHSKSQGSIHQTGFIAQEVKKVIPEAVSTTLDYIPDVYTMIRIEQRKDGSIAIPLIEDKTFPQSCDGSRILMMYDEKQNVIPIIVVRMLSATELQIASPSGQNIADGVYFLYGSQTDDYHVVDTNVIATHCISAVKSISAIQKKQQSEIDELREMVMELKARISS